MVVKSFKSTFLHCLFLFYTICSVITTPLYAVDKLAEARSVAEQHFMKAHLKSVNMQLSQSSNILNLKTAYSSPLGAKTPVFIFEDVRGGFAIVAQTQKGFGVIAYSETGTIQEETTSPVFDKLIEIYEQGQIFQKEGAVAKIEPVEPLFIEAGISLDQFVHDEVGGCPTGCVATAMAQIMLYHKYPEKGIGSRCYYHQNFGQICANFAETTYRYTNYTKDDLQLLSFHVGIAMDMNYCGDAYGSVPSSPRYLYTLQDYFGYHLITGVNHTEYVMNEIKNKRPVYCQLTGNPGHAVVLDGYDENGLFSVRFGWGGKHDGYFLLNSNQFINVGYYFGSNIIDPVFASPTIFKTNPSDSLALIKLHQSLNGATGWDLKKPVYQWGGVLVINERVVEIDLNTFATGTTGTIPVEIGNLTGLKKLKIQGVLSGNLPASISKLTELEYLMIEKGVESGTLTGTLPSDIGNLKKLKYLSLNRILEGSLPASIGELTELTHLLAHNGKLSGNLPSGIGNLKKLVEINLSSNQLTGSIPTGIGNLQDLAVINLSSNKLNGTLPESINHLKGIKVLALYNNQLSGTIPDTFHDWEWAKNINLSNNRFAGPVPLSLFDIKASCEIDLSGNLLDSFEEGEGFSGNVTHLNLSGNRLKTLPVSLNGLKSLKSLDVSHNQLESLPQGFGYIFGLNSINLSNNYLSTFPEELCSLPTIRNITLSSNKIDRFPKTIGSLTSEIRYVALDSNEISGRIPMTLLKHPNSEGILLNKNRLAYEDIPDITGIRQYVGPQKPIRLKQSSFPVSIGDTLILDIRDLAALSHKGNKYYWCRYPKYTTGWDIFAAPNFEKEGPVLTLIVDEENINQKFYCKIYNDEAPLYTNTQWGITDKCIPYLDSETISFSEASEKEILEKKYPEKFIAKSEELPLGEVNDGEVILFTNNQIRGQLVWQGSADKKTWYNIAIGMDNNVIKANVKRVGEKEVVLSPVNTAFYRSMLVEDNCEPVYGDTVKVGPLGTIIYDQLVDASESPVAISVDSVEVMVPKGFHEKGFKLTIVKLNKAPVANQQIIGTGPVYDIKVSFGNNFEMPLTIKLKHVPPALMADSVFSEIHPGWFDDINRKWIPFDNGGINTNDNTVQFMTNHLTKIAWYQLNYGTYTHYLDGNRVRVIYKWNPDYYYVFSDYELELKKQQLHQAPWLNPNFDPDKDGNPWFVQELAVFADSAIDRYERMGLTMPSKKINIYVVNMGGYGQVNFQGYVCGYLFIDPIINSHRNDLRATVAHELMHMLQDKYMITSLNNTFWMEANAPLASRVVWTPSELSDPEPVHILNSRKAPKRDSDNKEIHTIADILSKSWDDQDGLFIFEKWTADQAKSNFSSTFLHYMMCLRPGVKLNPVKMLTEHGWTSAASNWSWRTYLNEQVNKQLDSTTGDEYDAFVKYLVSGADTTFSALDTKSVNPYNHFVQNATYKNNSWTEALFGEENVGSFVTFYQYDFGKELDTLCTENKSINIPHLASQMVLLHNKGQYNSLMVEYKIPFFHFSSRYFKVYHGRYDDKTKTTVLTDISDSTNYRFVVEKTSLKQPGLNRNYSFLLFINTLSPLTIDPTITNFQTAYELKVRPMLNIESLDYLMLNDEPALNRLHSYDNGSKEFFSLNGTMVDFAKEPGYSNLIITKNHSDKKILNDSIQRIEVKFAYQYNKEIQIFRQGTSLGYTPPFSGEMDVEQIILYNFINNSFTVTQKSNQRQVILSHHNPVENIQNPQRTNSVRNDNFEVKFRLPANAEIKGDINEHCYFKTQSTAETRASVTGINHYFDLTKYSEDGKTTYTTGNYVNTDYSAAVVKFWGRFKVENIDLE